MGVSEKHAGDVPLLLNLKMGKIAPQWNVMFDDWFGTVTIEEENLPDFHSDVWSKMFGICAHTIPDKDKDVISTLRPRTEIQKPEADFAVLVGVQRIENKLLHLFGLPASQKLHSRNMLRGLYYPISPNRVEGVPKKSTNRMLLEPNCSG